MTKARLLELIIGRLNGQESTEDALALNSWADEDPANKEWLSRMTNEEQLEKEVQQLKNIDPAEGYAKWVDYMQTQRTIRVGLMIRWTAAAAILVLLAGTVLIRSFSRRHQSEQAVVQSTLVVRPGRNTAILTLGNGQHLLLDSAGIGNLAIQGNVRLRKLDSGSLSYSATGGKDAGAAYNTLATPRSGQYQVILPDGSHVWLNNISSLRYPTAFEGKERRVELIGEAYFEIAKDPGKPFIVSVNGEEVEVLGTSFNIKAYADEGATQTTLLTGAVQVRAGSEMVKLQPDEQAQWNGSGKLSVVKDVPSQDIISWKDGFFYFGRASLQEVMRQLARWYDVDVKYAGAVPNIEFGGKIDRSLPLNELLQFLDKNQVHFRLDGRTIIVLPS